MFVKSPYPKPEVPKVVTEIAEKRAKFEAAKKAKEAVEKAAANKAAKLAAQKGADTTAKVAGKTLAFFPLIFLAWDYYNTGSFIQSTITCGRDFLWPAMVVAAKSFNASPYQMLATNVGGIAWTIYNCFFAEHPEHEAVSEEVSTDLGSASTLKGKITA